MSEQKKFTVDEIIKTAGLRDDAKTHIDFCRFLNDNGFLIEPEGHTEDNKSGWQIMHMNQCIGHINFSNAGIWIDTCDFGSGDSADDALKETAWTHVRVCEHFSSGGKKCGCHDQPGLDKVILGKNFKNLCFANLEFINPDAKTLENIRKLLLLFRQNRQKYHRAVKPSHYFCRRRSGVC